jgi:MFS superfamily sulfate permease-like transporter
VSVFSELLNRRRARRWQRWTEVAPEDDYLRPARVITTIFVVVMLVVIVGIVLGLILALA